MSETSIESLGSPGGVPVVLYDYIINEKYEEKKWINIKIV